MSATDIPLKDVHYRIFATRESRKFRTFWFCPHPDCYGAYRSERLFDSREDAVGDGQASARLHESQEHRDPFHKFREDSDERVGGLVIHG
jgi:hypothetical protein